jgi:hypothetical protein
MDNKKQREIESSLLATAQLEKLFLEIDNLKIKNKWEVGAARYISTTVTLLSVITTLITIAGFWFGLFKFFNDREKDREDRIQNQIRADQDLFRVDLNQLIEMTDSGIKNSKTSLLRAKTILAELNSIAIRLPPEYKTRTTDLIIDFITSQETDFENTNFMEFDIITIKHWDDYTAHMLNDLNIHKLIFGKYLWIIGEIARKDPQAVRNIRYDPKHNLYDAHGLDLKDFEKWYAAVRGLKLHLAIAKQTPELWAWAIKYFLSVTENPDFVAQMFKDSIP